MPISQLNMVNVALADPQKAVHFRITTTRTFNFANKKNIRACSVLRHFTYHENQQRWPPTELAIPSEPQITNIITIRDVYSPPSHIKLHTDHKKSLIKVSLSFHFILNGRRYFTRLALSIIFIIKKLIR
jgi:hypothetical protein